MPRPIWKGQISFGLVTIPVALYSGENPGEKISFNLIDKRNHARIRNQRINEATGKPVEWGDIVKGYVLEDGSYIEFTDEELSKLEKEANQSIEITDFVDRKDIDLTFFDKPYYLIPEKRGRKGYVILREALKKKGKVGIAKVVIRTKEYLAALVPEGHALYLFLLRYPYEIRKAPEDELPGSLSEAGVTEKELEIAQQLVEAMTSDWEPEKYEDEYREKLKKYIEERAQQGGTRALSAEQEEKTSGEIIDMMELLRASMEKAKSAGKGGKKDRQSS